MKKIFSLFLVTAFFALNAQETANRFFYELTFKPKTDSAKVDKVMMILDITKEKSIYRDYTMVAQDSTLKIQFEQMQKAGVYKDMSKMITMPKFSEKIYKIHPDMKIQYVERISSGFTPMNIAYNEDLKFVWKTLNEKEKITFIVMLKNPVLYNPLRRKEKVEKKVRLYQRILNGKTGL